MAILRRASTASVSDPLTPAVEGYTRKLPSMTPEARLEARVRMLERRIERLERGQQLEIVNWIGAGVPIDEPADAMLGAMVYSTVENILWMFLPQGWVPIAYTI